MSPPLLLWRLTHHSSWQDLVPRSPARVYLWPAVNAEISACGFSAANNPGCESAMKRYTRLHNKRIPDNEPTQR